MEVDQTFIQKKCQEHCHEQVGLLQQILQGQWERYVEKIWWRTTGFSNSWSKMEVAAQYRPRQDNWSLSYAALEL